MTSSVRPTKKQRELLDYIERFINEHGYSPSYREIMNGCNYTSVATVSLHVGNLIKRGHLQKRDHSARSLEVVRVSSGQAAVNAGEQLHAQWLVKRVEDYLARQAEESAAGADEERAANGQLLIDALRVLGLEEQADGLQVRLSELAAEAVRA